MPLQGNKKVALPKCPTRIGDCRTLIRRQTPTLAKSVAEGRVSCIKGGECGAANIIDVGDLLARIFSAHCVRRGFRQPVGSTADGKGLGDTAVLRPLGRPICPKIPDEKRPAKQRGRKPQAGPFRRLGIISGRALIRSMTFFVRGGGHHVPLSAALGGCWEEASRSVRRPFGLLVARGAGPSLEGLRPDGSGVRSLCTADARSASPCAAQRTIRAGRPAAFASPVRIHCSRVKSVPERTGTGTKRDRGLARRGCCPVRLFCVSIFRENAGRDDVSSIRVRLTS